MKPLGACFTLHPSPFTLPECPARSGPFLSGVKPLLTLALTLSIGAPLFAIDTVDPKLDSAVRDLMPVCADAKIKYEDLSLKLPPRFTGAQVTVESERSCGGAYTAVLAPSGAIYLGNPWPMANEEG